jgi:hypothetical protein
MSKSPDPERLNVSDQAAYFKHGSIRKFSDIEIFQHSGKGIPQFMTGHKNCLQVDYNNGWRIPMFSKLNEITLCCQCQ